MGNRFAGFFEGPIYYEGVDGRNLQYGFAVRAEKEVIRPWLLAEMYFIFAFRAHGRKHLIL